MPRSLQNQYDPRRFSHGFLLDERHWWLWLARRCTSVKQSLLRFSPLLFHTYVSKLSPEHNISSDIVHTSYAITTPPTPALYYLWSRRRCVYHRETTPPSVLNQDALYRYRHCYHQWHSRPAPCCHRNQRRCACHRETTPPILLH